VSSYFDKQGNPIDVEKWATYFENMDYKSIARDVLGDGRVVSTIWLGIDHSYGDSDGPMIFETMIFESEGDFTDLYCDRYSTEQDALDGHKHAVELALTLEVEEDG